MCYFCGDYKFNLEQINGRLCTKCHKRCATHIKEYNKKGGQFGADPFWKSVKRRHGQDWKLIMNDPSQSYRR